MIVGTTENHVAFASSHWSQNLLVENFSATANDPPETNALMTVTHKPLMW